jgi:hypothetical protein
MLRLCGKSSRCCSEHHVSHGPKDSCETNQDAVKFNSFGFRRAEEANAWVETILPDHKFGLIVDAHMV